MEFLQRIAIYRESYRNTSIRVTGVSQIPNLGIFLTPTFVYLFHKNENYAQKVICDQG